MYRIWPQGMEMIRTTAEALAELTSYRARPSLTEVDVMMVITFWQVVRHRAGNAYNKNSYLDVRQYS